MTIAAHDTPEIFVVMLLLFLWMYWKKEAYGIFLALLIYSCSLYMIQEQRYSLLPSYSGQYEGTAEFKDGYKVDGDTVRGFLTLEDGGKVYASYRFENSLEKKQMEPFIHNSRFSVKGSFEELRRPSHEYAFDMAAYLKSNGATSTMQIDEMIYKESLKGFMAGMSDRRNNVKEHIRRNFPLSLTGEAEALLIGERESLTQDQQKVQQTLGISHLFAISGLHIGIISGLMYFLMVRSGMRKEQAMVLIIVILPLYALLAGGAPSVWRAVSMTLAVLALRMLKIRMPIAYILLMSFIVMLVIDPYVLYKIGFQLSYGASFGIIYSMKLVEATRSPLKMGLLITFLSQFTLYPILLFHFYGLSLSSFIVNSIFVPLYTLVILPMNGILLILTLCFQPAADVLFYFYEPFRNFIEHWSIWLAEWPNQMWFPGKPDAFFLSIMISCILLFYSLVERGFRWWKIGIGIFPAVVFTAMPYFDNALRVTFIDVGQGDSALIELPYRKGVYLIDTGGVLRFSREGFDDRERPFEIGRQVVAPYLQGNGISKIDALILSHPDADHVEGADEILQLFTVKEIHMTPGSQNSDLITDLIEYSDKATIRSPGRGSMWLNEKTSFTYLSPADKEYEGNNDSLVLLMEHEGFTLLFTGDLEIAGENQLMKLYGELVENITVLKVGHHGSKTSSGEDFLMNLNPAISIFSTGLDNRYGHPAEEVTERFNKLSLQTFNTAEQGTIEMVFRNGTYRTITTK